MIRLQDPKDFMQLVEGYRGLAMMTTAIRLDLASRLGNGAADAATLARLCKCSEHGVEVLCDALCSIGVLKKTKKGYRNSEFARRFLATQSPECALAGLAHSLESTFAWHALPEAVVRGRAPKSARRPAEAKYFERFIRGMEAFGSAKAAAVVKAAGLKNPRTLLDLGGAAGAFSLEFMKRHPGLEATVFDQPPAVRVAKKILCEKGFARPPFRQIAGDFFKHDLGGPYDAVLISNIVHIFDPEGNKRLLRRVHDALNPGGTVIIHDFLLNKSKDGPVWAALFALHMLIHTDGGRTYSAEELRDILAAAEFRRIRVRPNATENSGLVMATR